MTMRKAAVALALSSLFAAGAAQAADVSLYGTVAEGLYYTKVEGADKGSFGMAPYKQTLIDSQWRLRGREDLGNGYYAGFQLESGFNSDSGALADSSRLFNRVARLFVGNETLEVTMGRISTFTCASDPYSLFRKLRANMTGSGMPGMAPAAMVFNVGEMDNAVAFRTNAETGFFLQGFYSNGSAANESKLSWANNNHVAQLGTGWVGNQLRVGVVLSWERPEKATAEAVRKSQTKGVNLIGSYAFGSFAVSALFYRGWNDWRIGGAPDMPAIVNGMDTTVGFMSVGKPMGAHYLSAGLGIIYADWQGLEDGMRETKGTALQASVMYTYRLSKRTLLYAGASFSDADKMLDDVDRFNQLWSTAGMTVSF